VTVMLATAALLLCTILPSPVAFSSLVSAAGVPTITAYALICCKYTPKCFVASRETNSHSWTNLYYPWKIQACKMVSGPLLTTNDLHRLRMEYVPCCRLVLSIVLSSHCGYLQLLTSHFRRHNHLRYSVLVVHPRGQMATQCSIG
jgi:hypothetical protein